MHRRHFFWDHSPLLLPSLNCLVQSPRALHLLLHCVPLNLLCCYNAFTCVLNFVAPQYVQVVGEYNLAQNVNRFRSGSLVMRLPDRCVSVCVFLLVYVCVCLHVCTHVLCHMIAFNVWCTHLQHTHSMHAHTHTHMLTRAVSLPTYPPSSLDKQAHIHTHTNTHTNSRGELANIPTLLFGHTHTHAVSSPTSPPSCLEPRMAPSAS